ncbi:DUF6282 family protein [Shumkonia mesophila]|uniref:DUF6282 family protein n=1 Tax=Shumkonia mesophila TaxID=2838854 RepID=UPI0029344AA8|nr:DUF6282 family protein [Shumkonia mesophila]
MNKIDQLLRGAVDMHCHSGPGIFKRLLDHAEAAKEAASVGMSGLVLKDQHSMTAVAATLINRHVLPEGSPLTVFGSLVLNNATGGITPFTVEAALKYGARIIWMPTFSAKKHKEYHDWMASQNIANTSPKASIKLLPEPLLTVTDDLGRLLPQITTICELIAEADAVLGLGHISRPEFDAVIVEAKRCGVKRILLPHPEHIHLLSIDEMKAYAAQGVVLEHSYTLVYSKKLTHDYLFEMIRGVGAESTCIGSDMGQPGRPSPVQGFREFIAAMLERGLSEEEIRQVIGGTARRFLGMDDH